MEGVNFSSEAEKGKIAEAKKIIDVARGKGVVLRLIGGLAVRNHCVITYFCEREYLDMDFVGLASQDNEITRLFERFGYKENKNISLASSGWQKQFYKRALEDHVDVFLDFLRMEHDINLKNRLSVEDYTIPVSDLLLSKLQIYELNEKDIRDIITIVKDLPLDKEDKKGVINVKYIAELCSRDWGLHKDVTMNIDRCSDLVHYYNLTSKEVEKVRNKLSRIKQAIEAAPKTLQWKLRAKIGEKKAWRRTVEDQKITSVSIEEELKKRKP